MEQGLFTYSIPTRIIYGLHASSQLGSQAKRLGIDRALIVTDSGLLVTGVVSMLQEELNRWGIEHHLFSGMDFEPSIQTIEEGLKVADEFGCNGIIGLGGGSPLDTAKALSILVTNRGGFRDLVGKDSLDSPPLPFIAIPTTSGTGSEATRWSLVRDDEEGAKLAIGCWEAMPDVSICDPLLTLTKPPHLTAYTGMDALTHAIEALVNINCQPISEAMACKSISLISGNLRQAVANGANKSARDAMMMGSLTAALAFNVTGITSVHAISHVVGAKCHVPHGVANALLLPHVMEYSLIGAPDRYALIAEAMGAPSGSGVMELARGSVAAVKSLLVDIGLDQGLMEYGLKAEDLPSIAKEAAESGSNLLNPRQVNEESIHSILEKALMYPKDSLELASF